MCVYVRVCLFVCMCERGRERERESGREREIERERERAGVHIFCTLNAGAILSERSCLFPKILYFSLINEGKQ